MGEYPQASAPLDSGPWLLPRGPRLSAQPPGTQPSWAPSPALPAPREPLPALAADLSGGAEADRAGLDNREAPTRRGEGCGGARWVPAPRRDQCPGCSRSLRGGACREERGWNRWMRQGWGSDGEKPGTPGL